jgi:hypothetical protein
MKKDVALDAPARHLVNERDAMVRPSHRMPEVEAGRRRWGSPTAPFAPLLQSPM